jgi:hypothetical protein
VFRQPFLALLLGLMAVPVRGDCPLALRSYEDLDGRRMALEFDPPSTDRGVSLVAVAVIRHPERGEIGRFDVVTRPGYGDVLLTRGTRAHTAYFFSEYLRSTGTEEGSTLLFIDGLGLADWQEGELPGSRDHPIGDVLWKLVGCKE